MQRICILALLGLPAAGKTSFSRWLLASSSSLPMNIVHLCYDDYYTPPTQTQETNKAEDFDFKLQRLEILKLLASIVRAIRETNSVPACTQNKLDSSSRDFLIVCDDNNYYRSMRYQLLQLCRVHRLAYAQIYFETNLETALARNEERTAASSSKVPQSVIVKMHAKLEPPDPQQHAWEATTLILNANSSAAACYTSARIIAFTSAAFENVQEPPACVSAANELLDTAAVAHQLDLLLRRRIGELLNIVAVAVAGVSTAAAKQAKAAVLNVRRKEILRDFKAAQVNQQLDANDLSQYVDLLE